MDGTVHLATTFALSAGIGLLVGLERERKPSAKAGVRTFTLIALLGSLAGLLTESTGSAWAVAPDGLEWDFWCGPAPFHR